ASGSAGGRSARAATTSSSTTARTERAMSSRRRSVTASRARWSWPSKVIFLNVRCSDCGHAREGWEYGHYAGGQRRKSTWKGWQLQRTASFDAHTSRPYNEKALDTGSLSARLAYGGDTASTGVKTRGMHAERHRLVNPVEHNVTANTQLALAA